MNWKTVILCTSYSWPSYFCPSSSDRSASWQLQQWPAEEVCWTWSWDKLFLRSFTEAAFSFPHNLCLFFNLLSTDWTQLWISPPLPEPGCSDCPYTGPVVPKRCIVQIISPLISSAVQRLNLSCKLASRTIVMWWIDNYTVDWRIQNNLVQRIGTTKVHI